jgi:hypothetical protein
VEKFFDEVAQGKFFVVGKVAQGNTDMGIRDSSVKKMVKQVGTTTSYVNTMIS